MTPSKGERAALNLPVRAPLGIYTAIVVLYVLLLGWWVTFFAGQGPRLLDRIDDVGLVTTEAQRQTLLDESADTWRMLLFEGSFLGVLLLASMVVVVRSVRRDVTLARRQRDFVSAVTHELRSPLASARLYLDTLIMGRADPDKATRYLTHARQDLDRLSHLVEEVLTTQRVADGNLVLRPEPVDLSELIERRAARLGELYPEVRLSTDVDASVRVQADPRSLEQILDNLVSNAVKYGGAGGEVTLRVVSEEGVGQLVVSDRGPGLQGRDPRALTQAFVRGQDEDVRTHPGVGLGLFLVRSLVEAQHGDLTLRDRADGPGLEVCVALPPAREEAAVLEAVTA